jgi:hypothetical protein
MSLVDRTTNLCEWGPSQHAAIGAHREHKVVIGVLPEWDCTLVAILHSKDKELEMYVYGVSLIFEQSLIALLMIRTYALNLIAIDMLSGLVKVDKPPVPPT